MLQVSFSDQCISELNSFEKGFQMEIIESISSLKEDDFNKSSETLGVFSRKGETFYRLRIKDHRIYFKKNELEIHCYYLLSKNTLSDFLFRSGLPVSDEIILEKEESFWKYLESLKK